MEFSELREIFTNNVPVDVIKFIARENNLSYTGSNKIEVVEGLVLDAQGNDKIELLDSNTNLQAELP